RQDQAGALRRAARSPAAGPAGAGRSAHGKKPALVRSADAAGIPEPAPRRVARSRLAGALAPAACPVGSRAPAPTGPGGACVGRYVIVRASGHLVDRTRDTIVLDATSAVVDPVCGAAHVDTRPVKHGVRIAAQWTPCRGARTLRLRLLASGDCTLL